MATWLLVEPVLQPDPPPSPSSGSPLTRVLWAAPLQQEGEPRYVGIGRCASAPCHGNDAFPVWQEEDRHSKAYEVLFNKQSQTMAGLLRLESPEDSPRCLVCHSVQASGEERADSFDVSQGVGCEGCHGPASQWRVPHSDRSVERQTLRGMGLYPTKDLYQRARLCVSCHLGDATRQVDHELIAAGHPELTFELDTFTARMPPHWERDTSSEGARQWALGQAQALGQTMRLLARRIENPSWGAFPDFASFECASCHHPYPSAQRQQRGYQGHPGYPALRPSQRLILSRFLQALEPEMHQALQSHLEDLTEGLHGSGGSRQRARQAALELAAWTDSLSRRLQSIDYSASRLQTAISAISGDAEELAAQGFRTAEQARWAVEALYQSYRAQSGTNAEIERQIERLETVLRGRYPTEASE
ncbi:MAG TPA: multiheme c-type cytochrome [Acidobacteriota bacterium]|nr:multiheme c-type cytochrome [Acidobacteriota bacterium]